MRIPASLLVVLLAGIGGCSSGPAPDAAQRALAEGAERAGARDIRTSVREDGGLELGGKLDGHQFVLAVPRDWNREAVLFAQGYSVPGTTLKLPDDPMARDVIGLLKTPYSQGFLVGQSAYAKSGMGVETGATNTLRLKEMLEALGAERFYAIGGSMGGNIVMSMIEHHPDAFAGAIAGCGVTSDWPLEIGWLMDLRAVYNYFTQGTGYQLPGQQSIRASGIRPSRFAALRLWQMKRLSRPIVALFEAAEANPGGPESRLLDNIAAAGNTERDPASFIVPLLTVTLGQDDLNATFGGFIHDSTTKRFSSPHLSRAQNAALNAGIERVGSDAAAVDYATAWHRTNGHFTAKLISIYNEIDPLVPSRIQEPAMRRAIEAAGNLGRFEQRPLPSMRMPLPMMGVEGYVHCGFKPEQMAEAWNDLRTWVETDVMPAR